jgi:DNA-binding transcriptional ArsR family regulator
MRETYEIETIEQLRAISDMLRLRIMNVLERQARTATQVGEELGMPAAKVHYHMRELERVGLLELVETREKGGILEKYYQPIAHTIRVNKELLLSTKDETQAAFRDLLDQISNGYLHAVRRALANHESAGIQHGTGIHLDHLYLTSEELQKLTEQIQELTQPFTNRRGIDGEYEVVFSEVIYPTFSEQTDQSEEKLQKSWTAGITVFERKDLLKARHEGRRLQINVIGLCQFASDVTPSLVEETISSFSVVGKLIASPEVKAALKRKSNQA